MFLAKSQINGRGRLSREWISKKNDGIYMSVLFNTNFKTDNIPFLSVIAGLSVCKAINNFTDNKSFIKWPNDIIINNKKVCGILLESKIYSSNLSSIILGIGINVNNKYFDKTIESKATSIFLETGKNIEFKEIISSVLNYFSFYYNNFLISGRNRIKEEYVNLCASLNRNVSIIKENSIIDAFSVDVDSFGNLVVITENKEKLKINSGEVIVQGIY